MPELRDIGKRIKMKHIPTGEFHMGTVDDVNDESYVVRMDESASMFTPDTTLLVDPRYDSWEVVEVIG
jgi:hypothetical protein